MLGLALLDKEEYSEGVKELEKVSCGLFLKYCQCFISVVVVLLSS